MSNNGTVVWHDLMTKDPAKSKEFFCDLFGWEIKTMDLGSHKYDMIHNKGEGIGGIMPFENAPAEAPSHWTAYVQVDSVDSACGRATAAGGKVCVPPCDIPNIGRFAVIDDPTGGHISPYQSANPDAQGPQHEVPPVGHFCWEEMLTNDPVATAAFYGEVFGWKVEEMDMGPMGTYRIFKAGDKMVAGTMQMPPEAQSPPHWLSYIHADDVDAMAVRVNELGGVTYCPPTDIPNIGRFSVNADPAGAMFALFKHAGAPG